MALIADQLCEDEHTILDAKTIQEAYSRYQTKMGEYPAADEELTSEQRTCLHARFAEGRPPYVDFALWGPHGQRVLRKVKFKGSRIDPDGTISTIEITGPPSFSAWELSYSIFAVGCIMLGEISPARLEGYKKLIKRYHERYGPQTWAILYRADVRARLEFAERVRRRGQDELDAARSAGGDHPFSERHPWDWVWSQLAENEHSFWRKEVEEPSMLVLARSGKLTDMVDSDAPVSGQPNAQQGSKRAASIHEGGQEVKRRNAAVERVHNVDSSGHFTTNRRGTTICVDFNKNACSGTGGRCPRSHGHQCSKCLSPDHTADGPPPCSRTPGAPRPTPSGKGRGKGKKGGGKGGRRY